MNIEIKILTPDDPDTFIELIKVFEDVFEMKNFILPNKNHLQETLNKNNFLTLVASCDGKVVGGLTVYIFDQYYSEKPLAYIFDLAVASSFQRQGIGKKLISYLLSYCREKGFEAMFVQADKVDDYALDFYRSTCPSAEEEVVHFDYLLDEKKV